MKKIHFIDCGANIGSAIDWATNKYKERLIKIDAFEPEYLNYAILLGRQFGEHRCQNIVFHKKAVWIRNMVKIFNVQWWGSRTGSSLQQDKEHIIKPGQYLTNDPECSAPSYLGDPISFTVPDNSLAVDEEGIYSVYDLSFMPGRGTGVSIDVQCIDLSEWVFNNLKKENYNILKIDIEGAEYDVIEHLLNTGAHEYVDEWLVEFTRAGRAPESYNQEVVDRFKSVVSNYTDWGPMGEEIMNPNNIANNTENLE